MAKKGLFPKCTINLIQSIPQPYNISLIVMLTLFFISFSKTVLRTFCLSTDKNSTTHSGTPSQRIHCRNRHAITTLILNFCEISISCKTVPSEFDARSISFSTTRISRGVGRYCFYQEKIFSPGSDKISTSHTVNEHLIHLLNKHPCLSHSVLEKFEPSNHDKHEQQNFFP